MRADIRGIASTAKEYVIMALGMAIYSFGWMFCVVPAGGMGGGATGLSMVLNALIPSISIGQFVLIINAVLLLAASFVIGWNFGIKTIFCIVLLSVTMDMWGLVLPTDIILGYTEGIDSNRILMIILGAVLSGIGVVMCFTQGGSTGGTDIIVMMINKFHAVSYGKIVIISDFFIISSSLLAASDLADGIATMIYGYINMAVFGYTVDMIQAGNLQSSQIFIISDLYTVIADALINEAHRGVTVIDGTGWYSRQPKKIVMVVCRKRDASMILKLIRRIDPKAFITQGSVMGVFGEGFEALSKV